MSCGKKKLLVSVAVPPATVQVLSQWPLALNVASVTSVANDKDDNEMLLEMCTDLLEFASTRRPSDEGVGDQSSPQMRSLSSK